MISNPSLPLLINSRRLDFVLAEINTILSTNLSWLTGTYGRVERISHNEIKKTLEPVVYTSETRKKEYISLLPDSHLGNYCFFDIEDGEELDWMQEHPSKTTVNFGLVFWFNIEDVYPNNYSNKTLENIKSHVINVLKTNTITSAHINIDKIYQDPENVFSDYTTEDERTHFLMRPYGGLKIEGTLKYWPDCDVSVTPYNIQTVGRFQGLADAGANNVQDDEYFITLPANPEGMPAHVVIQYNPSITFSNDVEAFQVLGYNSFYAVAEDNPYGLTKGVLRVLVRNTAIYSDDTDAEIHGINANELYTFNALAFGGSNLIKERQ